MMKRWQREKIDEEKATVGIAVGCLVFIIALAIGFLFLLKWLANR